MGLEQIIISLRNLGFYDVILPWLFAFVIVYYLSGLIFKTEKVKSVPPIIGIVLASYLVAYTPYGTTLASFFTEIFGNYTILMSGILILLIIVSLILGAPEKGKDETIIDRLFEKLLPEKVLGIRIRAISKILFYFILIGIAVMIFLEAANIRIQTMSFNLSQGTLAIILFVSIIAMALYFVAQNPKEAKKQSS